MGKKKSTSFKLFLISLILILISLILASSRYGLFYGIVIKMEDFASTLSGFQLFYLLPLFRNFSERQLQAALPPSISILPLPCFASANLDFHITQNRLWPGGAPAASLTEWYSQALCQLLSLVLRGLWIPLPHLWMFFRLLKYPPTKKIQETPAIVATKYKKYIHNLQFF